MSCQRRVFSTALTAAMLSAATAWAQFNPADFRAMQGAGAVHGTGVVSVQRGRRGCGCSSRSRPRARTWQTPWPK